MPARRNGPLSGTVHGTVWTNLPVGKPLRYRGTPNGAKANVYRANKIYQAMKFRSVRIDGEVYIERLQ